MASGDVDRLRDDQWERLRNLVLGGREGQRGPRCDNRLFVDAPLWMARSGARGRDLPERSGDHQAAKRRYYHQVVLRGPLNLAGRHRRLESREACIVHRLVVFLRCNGSGSPWPHFRFQGGR